MAGQPVKIIQWVERKFKQGDTVSGVIKGMDKDNLNEEQITYLIQEFYGKNGRKIFKIGDTVLIPTTSLYEETQ